MIFMEFWLICLPGLLNHDWSAWRDAADVNNYLKPMVAATLS